MDIKHVCSKCGQSCGWRGPPFEGRWGKLRAILFHLRRRTLFSKDSKNYPFLRCINCGYVVTFREYSELQQIPREMGLLRGVRAVNQDIGKFMKHGHQASWYRKNVKAKVQPEDDDDEDYFDEQEDPAD